MTAFLFWFRGFLFDFPRFALIALSRARREKQSRSYQPTSIYHPLILVISYSLTLSSLITSSIPPAAGDKGPEQAATRTAKVKPTRFQSTPNHPLKRPNRGTSRPGCAPLHPPRSLLFPPSFPVAHFPPLLSSLHLARWSGRQRDLRYRSVSEVLRLAVVVGE